MARTASQVINILKKGDVFRELRDTAFSHEISNKALKLFWTQYPWRETLSELVPFYPILNESDHVTPDIQIPTDFWALDLVTLRVINGDSYELDITQRLPRASYSDWPTAISYMPEIAGFRLQSQA